MKIVIDVNNKVFAWGDEITRVDAQGETNLIKVEKDGGFFYIGTQDRDLYQIIDVPTVPQNIGEFKDTTSRETMREFGTYEYNYINGQFVEII